MSCVDRSNPEQLQAIVRRLRAGAAGDDAAGLQRLLVAGGQAAEVLEELVAEAVVCDVCGRGPHANDDPLCRPPAPSSLHVRAIEHWARADQGLRGQELRAAAAALREVLELLQEIVEVDRSALAELLAMGVLLPPQSRELADRASALLDRLTGSRPTKSAGGGAE